MDAPGKWNPLFAALAGFLVFLAYSLFPVPALTPEMSVEAAVVAGLRPAASAFPGLWRYLVSVITPDAFWLGLAGRIAAGVFAALAYLVLRHGFALLARFSSKSEVWSNRLAPALALLSSVMMASAEPVWRCFSLFTPAALTLILAALVVYLFERWMEHRKMWELCFLMGFIGIFTAETPFALIFPLFFCYAYNCDRKRRSSLSYGYHYGKEDKVIKLPVWRMFLCLVAGILLTLGLNLFYIVSHDTLGALGWKPSYIFFNYGNLYLKQLAAAANWSGYILGFALMVMPLAVILELFPRLSDDEDEMPFHLGLIVLLVSIVAYFEQGPLRGAWYWTWIGEKESVSDPALLGLFSCFATSAVAFGSALFTIDAFSPSRPRSFSGLVVKCYRYAVGIIALVALAFVILQLPHSRIRRILAFNDSAIKETVRETNGAKWIFTDGSADATLELEAYRNGQVLRAINLMGTASDYDVKIRLRDIEDSGDRLSAQMGAPVLLRVWACDKENGLKDVALQLGLELWKREQLAETPVGSAFIAATRCLRDEDIRNAAAIAKSFADRIAELTDDANSQDVSPSVRKEFFTISWRISRMARFRHDQELAEKLESLNTALRRMLRDLEYERLRVFMQMTPKEGLEFALKRADFSEAARYAAAVLKINKRDANANFGMGMYFLLGNRYDNAEPYFRKVLEVRPDEPAALNNLSILCRKTRRYDEAVKLAERALKILPDSEEVQKTHRDAVNKAP